MAAKGNMGDQQEQEQLAKFDPGELARLYGDIAQKSAALLTNVLANGSGGPPRSMADELGISKAFFEAWSRMLADPMRMAEAQMKLWQDYWSLWQSSHAAADGPAIGPRGRDAAGGDRRFKHEDWQNNFLYDYIKQSYLIAAKHLHRLARRRAGPRRADREESRFLHAPVHRRALAVELRADQSRSDARDGRERRAESRQRLRQPARGSDARQRRRAEAAHDRRDARSSSARTSR